MRTSPDQTTEDILKIVEERYGALLKTSLVGIAVSDGDEVIYKANDKFLNIIGYSRKDFEAGLITWSTITPQKYDRLDEVKLFELLEESVTEPFEKEYLQKNGQAVPVLVGAEMVSYDSPINISFVIDVSKQKQAEKDKLEMVATIGHELKTPLSVLRVQAELLGRAIQTGISQKKIIKELKEFDEQIANIDAILNNILLFSKRRTNLHNSKPVEFNVLASLKKVISDIRLVSDRKIILEQSDKDCYILGNEREVRELLSNLISNALKYSPENTSVKAHVRKHDDTVHIEVTDEGRGIKKSDQHKIFQKSFQVRNTDVQHEQSSQGIGLYLCREIVKRHNGKISVVSELGKGSTFVCSFKAYNPD